MAEIRGKDTQPELFVRRFVHACGFRFRLHVRELPGRPDMVLSKWGTCIFVNGCFWHSHRDCAYARVPSTRASYWTDKLERNVARDAAVRAELRRLGWRVIDIWECGIKDVRDPDLYWLAKAIRNTRQRRIVWPRKPTKPRLR